MINFYCQHCHNHMRVDAQWAGRDACCGKCRRFIIIPGTDNDVTDVFSLPVEKRLARMEKLLTHITGKLHAYQKKLSVLRNVRGDLIPPETWLNQKLAEKTAAQEAQVASLVRDSEARLSALQASLDARENRLAELHDNAASSATEAVTLKKQLDEMIENNEHRAAEIAQLNTVIEDFKSQMARNEAENDVLTSRIETLLNEQETLHARLAEVEQYQTAAGEGAALLESFSSIIQDSTDLIDKYETNSMESPAEDPLSVIEGEEVVPTELVCHVVDESSDIMAQAYLDFLRPAEKRMEADLE